MSYLSHGESLNVISASTRVPPMKLSQRLTHTSINGFPLRYANMRLAETGTRLHLTDNISGTIDTHIDL